MINGCKSILFASEFDNWVEFVHEIWEIFCDEVCTNRVFLWSVIGGFPLVNIVLIRKSVSIMSIMTFSNFKISKSDAPRDSSQIGELDAFAG